MRNIYWLPIAGALAMAGCKDQGPKLASSDQGGGAFDSTRQAPRPDGDQTATRLQHNAVEAQRDAVLGPDGRASVPTEPAHKTAERVQRDAKEGNLEQERSNEQAQADFQKQDSMKAEQQTRTEAASSTQTAVGTVAQASDAQIQLKSGEADALQLAVDPSTSIRLDGREVRGSQITEGSEVRASYKAVDGKLTALRLDVRSTGATTKKAVPDKN